MKIHHLKRCPLSKSNIFYQNFMKLGHIVQYRDVFFKFDNGPYRSMLSAVMALFYENQRFKRCLLSKSNSFDQNSMKLCHIV